MPEPFRSLRVEHSSIVDRVADELRRAIFDGELEPRTPLREVALAESLGVARSTIRESLGLLVADGLAVRETNRGVAVASPDPESVRDVCRARGVLEVAGLRRWPEATEQAREAVRQALTAYADAVAAGASYRTLNHRHLAVHVSLVGLLDSPRLVAMAESLTAELRLALARIDRTRGNARDQVRAHRRLLDLLERGEVDAAADDLAHHLAQAEVDLAAALAPTNHGPVATPE